MGIKFNTAKFGGDLDRANKVLKKNPQELVYKYGGLLTLDLARMTPPHGKNPIKGDSWNEQRKIGQHATAKEVYRAMQPIDRMGILRNPKNQELADNIKAALGLTSAVKKSRVRKTKGAFRKAATSKAALQAIFKNAGIINPVFLKASRELHTRARVRGRVHHRFPSALIIDGNSVRTYVKRELNQVGRAKSGWKKAAAALGRPLPNWIADHNEPGDIIDKHTHAKPEVIVFNRVPYRHHFRIHEIVRAAETNRRRAFIKEMEAIQRYAARKFKGR